MKYGNMLAWILGIGCAITVMTLSGGFWLFINIPSILLVLGVSYFLTATSFGFRDCHLGFKGIFSVFFRSVPQGFTDQHMGIIRSLRGYLFLSGLFGALTGLISLLYAYEDIQSIYSHLALICLTLFVSLFFILFFCQPALAYYEVYFAQQHTPASEQKSAPLTDSKSSPKGFSPLSLFTIVLVTTIMAFYFAMASAPVTTLPQTDSETSHSESQNKPNNSTEKNRYRAIYRFDPMIVNLQTDDGNFRYLKTEISLGLKSKLVKQELKLQQDKIQDQVLSLLASQKVASLQSPEDKQALKRLLKNRINQSLNISFSGQSSKAVMQVFFRSFVIK